MKKIYTLVPALAFLVLSLTSFANQQIVGVGVNNTNTFTPPFFTAEVGDTVTWVLVSGVHTVVSTSVPVGASAFSSPTLSNLGDMFIYVITTSGTYNYFCSIHGMMMSGSFTATLPTGIPFASLNTVASVFPNPCSDKIYVETAGISRIEIFNLLGENVTSINTADNLQTKFEIDLSALLAGTYFYRAYRDKNVIETRKIIKVK